MPPRKPTSASAPPPSTGSRKSSRIAGDAAPESETPKTEKGPSSTKKRTTEPPKSGPASKKAKATPKSQTEKSAATAEKDAEAPKSAPADTGSKGALKLGDSLPKISLRNNSAEEVDADTPSCTTQACGFRDHFTEISELGYQVYGLSKDKPEAQQKWITKRELNYKLLCDPESKLIKRLGAFVQPNNTKRSHFIFEKGSGKLVDVQMGVTAAEDPGNCLKFIKQHH
ncbi:MAG: hypothetical protein TREMPRED_004334, partial [Tremellales sp. Tagirdzhanova-0007]